MHRAQCPARDRSSHLRSRRARRQRRRRARPRKSDWRRIAGEGALRAWASFPFELGKGGRGVTAIIVVEQLPVRLFSLTGGLRRRGEGGAARDGRADVAREPLEISPLLG